MNDIIKQFKLPNYIKGKSFAEASKLINNKFKDRNDVISTNTKNTLLKRLSEAQEYVKSQNNIQNSNEIEDIATPQQKMFDGGELSQDLSMLGTNGALGQHTGINQAITALDLGNVAFGKTGIDTSGSTDINPDSIKPGMIGVTNALKGAQAGAMFGPVGAGVGAAVGLGAGLIGGNRAKKDAEKAEENFRKSKYFNNYMNTQNFDGVNINAYGGNTDPIINPTSSITNPTTNLVEPIKMSRNNIIKTVKDNLNNTSTNDKNPNSRYLDILGIQKGITHPELGEGAYFYSGKTPLDPGFDHKVNREFIKNNAIKKYLNSSQGKKYQERLQKQIKAQKEANVPITSYSYITPTSGYNFANGGKMDNPIIDYKKTDPKIGNLSKEQALDVEKQRKWLNEWNKNRTVNGKKVNSNIDVPFSEQIYTDDLNFNNTSPIKTFGEFDTVSNRIRLDENYMSKSGIPSHELTHRFEKDYKSTNPENYNKYISNPINKYLKKSGNFTPYQLDPDETHSEINRLRYNQGYKPDQIIKSEDLNKVNLKDYNFNQFTNDELIDVLNSTANTQKNSNINYAAHGGKINKYANGGLKPWQLPSSTQLDDPNYIFSPLEGTLTNQQITSDLVNQFNNRGNNTKQFSKNVNPHEVNISNDANIKNTNSSNIDSSMLRYSPLIMDAYQLATMGSPEVEKLDKLNNQYKKQYLDEKVYENIAREQASSASNAIGKSGVSTGQLINANLATQLNATKSISDAYNQIKRHNIDEEKMRQQVEMDNNRTNLSQSNLEKDINARNRGAYKTEKSKLLGNIGTNLGLIGKEELYKKYPKMMGLNYDWNGQYFINKNTGEKVSVEEANKLEKKSNYKSKGGYLSKTSLNYLRKK